MQNGIKLVKLVKLMKLFKLLHQDLKPTAEEMNANWAPIGRGQDFPSLTALGKPDKIL